MVEIFNLGHPLFLINPVYLRDQNTQIFWLKFTQSTFLNNGIFQVFLTIKKPLVIFINSNL